MIQAVLCVPTIEVSTSQQGNLLNDLVTRFVGINCWCSCSYDAPCWCYVALELLCCCTSLYIVHVIEKAKIYSFLFYSFCITCMLPGVQSFALLHLLLWSFFFNVSQHEKPKVLKNI